MEDLIATSQAFDEIVDAELALDRGRAHAGAARRRDRRRRRLLDLSLDRRLEPVQVVSFLPGPYRVRALSRARARGRDLEGADRTLSRGRPADLDLRHGAADRHGRAQARARSRGDPPAQSRASRARVPVQDRLRHRLGQLGFIEGLEGRCDNAGYAALRAEQAKARAAGRWFGIGIACYAELTGIGSRISVAPGMPINTGTETATIRIDSTGAVTAAFGVASHGQGLETTLAQVVAEHLGCRVEDIRVLQGDSAAVPDGTGTYASRSTVLAGGAAALACRELAREDRSTPPRICSKPLPPISSRRDGRVTVAGTDRSVTFRQTWRARSMPRWARLPHEAREELAATKIYDPVFGTTTSATHIVGARDRPGDLSGAARPLRRRGGLRPHHQSVDRRRPGSRRRRAGHRRRALRGGRLRRRAGRSTPRAWSITSFRRPAKFRRSTWCTSRPNRRPRSVASAAWARVARSARRPRSPTRSPMRSRRSASRSTSFP